MTLFNFIEIHKKRKIEISQLQDYGNNNQIDISKTIYAKGYIYGNNNLIKIEDSIFYGKHSPLLIYIVLPDCPVNNCKIVIRKNFSSNGTQIRICEDNTEITIGEDCMFSDEVKIWASDTHTILDSNNNVINIGKYINIGNHVWLCNGVTILKNTCIGNNSIIGTKAVVSGKFNLDNCIIAGNPAIIRKKDINWKRERPQNYIKNGDI